MHPICSPPSPPPDGTSSTPPDDLSTPAADGVTVAAEGFPPPSDRFPATRGKCVARAAVVLAVALAAVPTTAAGSRGAAAAEPQQDVYLELRRRAAQAVTLALPPLAADPGADEAARRIHEVLGQDLGWSMVFELVPRDHLPEGGGDGTPEWVVWRRTGAEALIQGRVRRVGDDAYIADFRLYDVQSGRQVIGKTYEATALERLRYVAHAFNDEAVLYYTGIPGVASTMIAFVSSRVGAKEVFVMDHDGHNQVRITVDGFLGLSPALSPSIANRIAYTTYRMKDGAPDQDIAMLFSGGGAPRPITDAAGMDTAPTWSPDGQWIAFSSSRDGNEEVYVMRPDGTDVRRLTFNSAIDTSPTFSPNGRQIAFISNRAGTQHLYVMGIDGTNVQRLLVEGTQIADPSWNPQQPDLIAYTASVGGNNFEIFVYDFRSRQSIQLTRGFGRDERPTWSPDGRQVAFESTQGGRTQVYAMGIDGSRLRALTREGNNTQPSWGGQRPARRGEVR